MSGKDPKAKLQAVLKGKQAVKKGGNAKRESAWGFARFILAKSMYS